MSYARSASVYDAIYIAMKDYRREAERVKELFYAYAQVDTSALGHAYGYRLLNVACGTGLHDQYLRQWFDIEGVDLEPSMLAIARDRLPDVKFHQADMTNFEMGKCYDLVTCLFSAIGHMLTLEQMRKAVSEMAGHLRPGGVLVVEPFIDPDDYVSGRISVNHVEQNGLVVVHVNRSLRQGHIVHLMLDHYVSRNGEYEDPYTEELDVAMYTTQEYMEAFRSAGLEVWHDAEGLMGRGLFVGRKPL